MSDPSPTPPEATDTPPAPPQASEEDVAARYTKRVAETERELEELRNRSLSLSRLRLITFLGAAGLGGYGLARALPVWGWALCAMLAAGFVALVVAHALLATRETDLELRRDQLRDGLARLGGAMPTGTDDGQRFIDADHPYGPDIDLFGAGSLFQRLNTTYTGLGEQVLARWLSSPTATEALSRRVRAVKDLRARPALREELAYQSARADAKGRPAEPLLDWAEAPAVVGASADGAVARRQRPLLTAAYFLAPAAVGFIAAAQVGVLPGGWSRLWLVAIALNLFVWVALRPTMDRLVVQVSSRETPFGKYRSMLEVLEQAEPQDDYLAGLKKRLDAPNSRVASQELAALERLMGWADLRHNALIHVLANMLFLYDVWVALALERWRGRVGGRVRGWLEALGEWEALSALGTFAYENPSYCFAEVRGADAPYFVATNLSHPLLPASARVANDVALGGEASPAYLVTGSNMSGKSTLLRSMGCAAVMAQAGSVVAASKLEMTPLSVQTSMRIRDSLEAGVSHFYAELRRLKCVVDAAAGDVPVLFLLDEVLHGTNSRERNIGARAVVAHLLEQGAIGAVSSHDLALSSLEKESDGQVRNVHLREQVEGSKMTFDYKLRTGVVTSSNALRLMQRVGLPLPPESAPGDADAPVDAT